MDFLFLILAYVLGFLFCVFIYFFGDHPFLKHGVIGAVRKAVWQVLKHVVPMKLTEDLLCKVHVLLNSRNQFFRITFGTMVVLGHIEFIIDMLPMLYKYLPEENHVVLPIISVFLNLFFYNKCCNDDPGEITARSLHKYKHVYPYDNKMFVSGVKCKTCQLVKPARSKHCSICDRCVHRFDHHCIWTNSDVGGMTHGSFVLFLLSLTFILSNGVYVICRCLILHSEHYKLLQATVMTPDGDMKSITLLILFQETPWLRETEELTAALEFLYNHMYRRSSPPNAAFALHAIQNRFPNAVISSFVSCLTLCHAHLQIPASRDSWLPGEGRIDLAALLSESQCQNHHYLMEVYEKAKAI